MAGDVMNIWLITGYTKEVGVWEVELFKNKGEAVSMFNHYKVEYEATTSEDNEWYATCNDGVGRFWLEERFI